MNEVGLEPLIPIVAIAGGLAFGAYSMYLKMKARELMHAERLAMIEKGLQPPPLSAADLRDFPRAPRRSSRHAGIFLVGAGIGVGVLIGLTNDVKTAIGVGGVIVMVGIALLVNAMLDRREAAKTPSPNSNVT